MKENIMGVDVTTLNEQQLMSHIEDDIKRFQKVRIVAINPEKIMMAEQDLNLRQLLNESTYQIPDGIGVSIASKLSGGIVKGRVTGIGMMGNLLALANKNEWKIFMYGAKPEIVNQAAQNIQKKYPKLIISGTLDGYVNDTQLIMKTINEVQPHILFVALGSPKQELFIKNNMEQLHVNVFQGVGGSFDVFSGHVKRAPELFLKTGTEWLYRLIKQPSRIKRQWALPMFLAKVVTSRRRNHKQHS
ncbi:WecB/TagA/CpsF family glycosyltransferase [Paenisporosarcina sp. TG-14]|uniref:WecB/TagA/CpsF family glycosyltransferase n=1 Tax=Paenisporosarcina sp. TG-14 TaxID=1231057 RepID=UPI000307B3C8|nr:WecB/TagA/CpsF family glycosyltransferase [Paenisporosarcina sp. TG-14]